MNTFYEILQGVHSYWAYLVLLLVTLTTIITFIKASKKAEADPNTKKIGFFTVMTVHLQLVFGVILYIISPMVIFGAETMKTSELRLYALEHPLMMLLGIILITIANVKLKKAEKINMTIPILFLIGLILMLSRIPYEVWFK
ncbi:hypothetical protein UJ101_01041 [Flavobacteriaceae bacterium UJ101]|nr:hypothetical protein UJ101_01041 [Flavobacteriaceae bacterium UJ101]